MDSVNVPLGNAFSSFITEINNVTNDWRIGVATDNDGCFNSGVIDANTANYSSVFQSAVATGGCSSGYPSCDTESLFKITNKALVATSTGSCNQNFLRTGAFLHIIMVSDEKEQSGVGWSSWLSQYVNYVSTSALLKVSTIADIAPLKKDQCGDPYGPGDGAGGYVDMAGFTGGEILDVCTSDWSNKTQDLALATVAGINEVTLTGMADEPSIEVYVDGVQWTSDWHYDSTTQSIVFDVAMDGGEDVEVVYIPQAWLVDYLLTDIPVAGTISVFVDGVEWTSDWTYDATSNSIVLDVEVPDGTDVEITYVPAGSPGSYPLSNTPDPTTIIVYVDGVETISGWNYDASTNSVVFSPPLVNGEAVDVEYATGSSSASYTLSSTPDESTITVEVGGSVVSNWSYSASTNSIVFSGSVPTSASVTVSYLRASASMSYMLSNTPDSTTIVVYVDGYQWTTDWHYDSATNSVVFDVEVADGETIEVTYAISGTGGSYQLSKLLVESTLTVVVNGVQWTSGWTYNSATNSIEFQKAPPAGATVEVTYLRATASSSYTLAKIPVVSTLIVYVDGLQWMTDWQFDAATNSIVFDVPLGPSSLVEVEYIAAKDWIDYLLSGSAQSGTIVVTVDGQNWSIGWTYNAASDTVVFDVDPPEGATVEITYIDPTLFGPLALSETPVASTVEVYLDGVLWTTGWSYDASNDTIAFSANLPPGTVIDVSYNVPSTCP
jgi:hypothetical protein